MDILDIIGTKVSNLHCGAAGIYAIYNNENSKVYIGQTVDLYKRAREHASGLNNRTHFNKHLQRAWDKYGEDAFSFYVILECQGDELDAAELKYIALLDTVGNGYNMVPGPVGYRGSDHPMFGRHHSDESRAKMSAHRKGKYTGKDNNFYGVHRTGADNPFYGRRHSEESIARMLANRPDICGESHHRARAIVMVGGDGGIVHRFCTITAAGKYVVGAGIAGVAAASANSNIHGAIKRRGSAYGYYWFDEGDEIKIKEFANPSSKKLTVVPDGESPIEFDCIKSAAEYIVSNDRSRSKNVKSVSVHIGRAILYSGGRAYGCKFALCSNKELRHE